MPFTGRGWPAITSPPLYVTLNKGTISAAVTECDTSSCRFIVPSGIVDDTEVDLFTPGGAATFCCVESGVANSAPVLRR